MRTREGADERSDASFAASSDGQARSLSSVAAHAVRDRVAKGDDGGSGRRRQHVDARQPEIRRRRRGRVQRRRRPRRFPARGRPCACRRDGSSADRCPPASREKRPDPSAAGTARSTGSLNTTTPGGTVVDGRPPNVNARSDAGHDAPPCHDTRCALRPMRSVLLLERVGQADAHATPTNTGASDHPDCLIFQCERNASGRAAEAAARCLRRTAGVSVPVAGRLPTSSSIVRSNRERAALCKQRIQCPDEDHRTPRQRQPSPSSRVSPHRDLKSSGRGLVQQVPPDAEHMATLDSRTSVR